MVNYYEILGIPESAGSNDIKSAFRRLAKLYHPDKNPAGQEQFRRILKAYEVLSNPTLKRSYDLKLKYHRNANSKPNRNKNGTKTWSFEEKELQRRKYYDEHIKKYAKTNPIPKVDPKEIKPNYNEYKYILFATPIAVALFLLIVNLATGSKPIPVKTTNGNENSAELTLKMGDSPYLDHFGAQQHNSNDSSRLIIKNQSGNDLIICLFEKDRFIRSCFISDGFFAEIPQLPAEKLKIRYSSGKKWKASHFYDKANIYGGFSSSADFYRGRNELDLMNENELTIVNGVNEGFTRINEIEFFNKNEYDKKN